MGIFAGTHHIASAALRHPLERVAFGHPSVSPVIVDLVDGTYELFRHFYGNRRGGSPDAPWGAVAGVLGTIVRMLEDGSTHIGVATDHVIESFRNDLWAGYKTGEGIDPALAAQFLPLETALRSAGVQVWAMTVFEADDALAAAAHLADRDARVQQVRIWTPDKDLAQSVVGERVVQVDRRSGQVRNAEGVRAKFGVDPALIPDWLALVGDTADGFPGVPKIGAKTAARLIERYGPLDQFPPEILGDLHEDALLFRTLATLRTDAPVSPVDAMQWRAAAEDFGAIAAELGNSGLGERLTRLTRQTR